MNASLCALLSITLSVAAQFCMRHGMLQEPFLSLRSLGWVGQQLQPLARPWVLVGLLVYAASAVVWLRVLADWEVSKAYPLVGLGFVLATVVGYFMGEALTPLRVAGALLIALGVALIGRS